MADCRTWSFFGEAADGNVRTLSLVHATRVLIIVTIAPIPLTQLHGIALNNPIGVPASTIPLHEMALMIIAALVGWKGGERIGLFGASILGPMIVAAMADLGFVITHHLARIMLVVAGAPLVANFFKVEKG